LFLDRKKPSYIGGMLEMANARLFGHWNSLTEALRTGQQQNEAKEDGTASPFAALYADPGRLKVFLGAMTGVSHGANMAIAKKAPWAKYKTFADIGPAQGDLAVQIALANPHLTGIGFDLAAVGPIFEEYATANSVSDRLRFQPGDFFTEALPVNVDVITMGHILHDWDVDEKRMLVKKAYDALNPGGAFVVYDAIIDDDRSKNSFGLLMSLNMLIESPGGFDYTGAECIGWMKEAGFRDAHVEHLVGPDSMVVGFK
jgi:SAM-dependent methyltransferase